MDRFRSLRRLQLEVPVESGDGVQKASEARMEETRAKETETEEEEVKDTELNKTEVEAAAKDETGLFMGMKVRRRAGLARGCKGDYVGVASDPFLSGILTKQGDSTILFADRVIKFNGSGKMKKQIMLISDFAIYLVDPDADVLKRRIALAAVEKICLSKFTDNFFSLIVPTEYDCLMASTRKAEIAHVLVGATKGASEELEVVFSNRFEYNAAADMVKEIEFEEVEGGIITRITRKEME